ncbi:hypothetical protein Fcan01_19792 [Folsomia candida]|uniref:VWFC domain-containing protein n=1 Tax=Folsomia candida TaxID=158441 RepID=A0A226DM63_FOLCA|nr:hypothetical protein Fcan01_19792 [Folsomia candida]
MKWRYSDFCEEQAGSRDESPAVEGDDVDGGGCYYMFNHYGEGDRIFTNEPCLNCTCHNSMLMCYLRVCPFTKPIGQDCTIEKKPDQCCPVISCPEVPVSLVTPSTLTTTTVSTTSLATVSESTELAHYERGCNIEDKFYPDGAQVEGDPTKPCELCYCIRNKTACVMQECILHVEGCQPVFQPGVCCPVRYQCDYPLGLPDETTTSVTGLITTTLKSIFTSTPVPGGCIREGEYYTDGSQIPGATGPCEHCYCMRGEIVCAVQECGAPLENEGGNCTAIAPPPGMCCPEKYSCDGDKEPEDESSGTTVSSQQDETAGEVTQPSAISEPHPSSTTQEPGGVDSDATTVQSTSDENEISQKLGTSPSTQQVDQATTISPAVSDDQDVAAVSSTEVAPKPSQEPGVDSTVSSLPDVESSPVPTEQPSLQDEPATSDVPTTQGSVDVTQPPKEPQDIEVPSQGAPIPDGGQEQATTSAPSESDIPIVTSTSAPAEVDSSIADDQDKHADSTEGPQSVPTDVEAGTTTRPESSSEADNLLTSATENILGVSQLPSHSTERPSSESEGSTEKTVSESTESASSSTSSERPEVTTLAESSESGEGSGGDSGATGEVESSTESGKPSGDGDQAITTGAPIITPTEQPSQISGVDEPSSAVSKEPTTDAPVTEAVPSAVHDESGIKDHVVETGDEETTVKPDSQTTEGSVPVVSAGPTTKPEGEVDKVDEETRTTTKPDAAVGSQETIDTSDKEEPIRTTVSPASQEDSEKQQVSSSTTKGPEVAGESSPTTSSPLSDDTEEESKVPEDETPQTTVASIIPAEQAESSPSPVAPVSDTSSETPTTTRPVSGGDDDTSVAGTTVAPDAEAVAGVTQTVPLVPEKVEADGEEVGGVSPSSSTSAPESVTEVAADEDQKSTSASPSLGEVVGEMHVSSTPDPAESLSMHSSTTTTTVSPLPEGSEADNEIGDAQDKISADEGSASSTPETDTSSSSSAHPTTESSSGLPTSTQESVTVQPPVVGESGEKDVEKEAQAVEKVTEQPVAVAAPGDHISADEPEATTDAPSGTTSSPQSVVPEDSVAPTETAPTDAVSEGEKVTEIPVAGVTDGPISVSSEAPTGTEIPSESSSASPTETPDTVGGEAPSATEGPSAPSTEGPVGVQTEIPSAGSSETPSDGPTEIPSAGSTETPSAGPTEIPSAGPTEIPSAGPTEIPSAGPTEIPTAGSSEAPSDGPTEIPSAGPTEIPSSVSDSSTVIPPSSSSSEPSGTESPIGEDAAVIPTDSPTHPASDEGETGSDDGTVTTTTAAPSVPAEGVSTDVKIPAVVEEVDRTTVPTIVDEQQPTTTSPEVVKPDDESPAVTTESPVVPQQPSGEDDSTSKPVSDETVTHAPLAAVEEIPTTQKVDTVSDESSPTTPQPSSVSDQPEISPTPAQPSQQEDDDTTVPPSSSVTEGAPESHVVIGSTEQPESSTSIPPIVPQEPTDDEKEAVPVSEQETPVITTTSKTTDEDKPPQEGQADQQGGEDDGESVTTTPASAPSSVDSSSPSVVDVAEDETKITVAPEPAITPEEQVTTSRPESSSVSHDDNVVPTTGSPSVVVGGDTDEATTVSPPTDAPKTPAVSGVLTPDEAPMPVQDHDEAVTTLSPPSSQDSDDGTAAVTTASPSGQNEPAATTTAPIQDSEIQPAQDSPKTPEEPSSSSTSSPDSESPTTEVVQTTVRPETISSSDDKEDEVKPQDTEPHQVDDSDSPTTIPTVSSSSEGGESVTSTEPAKKDEDSNVTGTTPSPISSSTTTESSSSSETSGQTTTTSKPSVSDSDLGVTIHPTSVPEVSDMKDVDMEEKIGGGGQDLAIAVPTTTSAPSSSHEAADEGEDGPQVPGEGHCFVEGKTYKNGSSIPPTTPCHIVCACQNSIVHCLLVHCNPPPSDTGDCKPIYRQGVCCPMYDCEDTRGQPVTVTPGPAFVNETNIVTVTPETPSEETSGGASDDVSDDHTTVIPVVGGGSTSEETSSETSSAAPSQEDSQGEKTTDVDVAKPIHDETDDSTDDSVSPLNSTTTAPSQPHDDVSSSTSPASIESTDGPLSSVNGTGDGATAVDTSSSEAPLSEISSSTGTPDVDDILGEHHVDEDEHNVTSSAEDSSPIQPGSLYPVTTTTTVTPSTAPWPYPTSTTAPSVMTAGACLFDSRVYMSAQQIPRDDPCDFCFCFRGDIICLQQSCPPPIPGCYEEPIPGFCCPRYECPVGNGNVTTQPPIFPPSYYHNQILNGVGAGGSSGGGGLIAPINVPSGPGCEVQGEYYESGQIITSTSGPCLECRCGMTGMMECDPRECQPEPMLRKMIAAITTTSR